jgi:ADP-heptose:LPS heptosyltransferase
MKVDTMRAIDRWAGVPLCFVLTLLRWLLPGRQPGRPCRILFIELSEMGSTILADPAMRKARQVFGAEIFFVIFARNVASLDFLGTVPRSNVAVIREDGFSRMALDTLRVLLWIRRQRIDTAVDLELFSRFTALLTGLSGAANRVGFYRFHNEGLYRGELLTHRVAYNPHMHIAKNFIALVNALSEPLEEIPHAKALITDREVIVPQVSVSETAKADMKSRVAAVFSGYKPAFHRLVLFNPHASELLPQRRWPHGHFAMLAHRALDCWSDALILITGARSEEAEAEKLRMLVDHPRMVNFAGRCPLLDLVVLYSIAEVMVTNDSGPAHFASVTKLPTIVLFGPETPALYRSLGNSEPISAGLACSPCVTAANHRKSPCRNPVCMQSISPDRVFDSVRAVLNERPFLGAVA